MSAEILAPFRFEQGGDLPSLDWQSRLADIMDMLREMSAHSDPQEMVAAYGRRIGKILPADRRISLSRRASVGAGESTKLPMWNTRPGAIPPRIRKSQMPRVLPIQAWAWRKRSTL